MAGFSWNPFKRKETDAKIQNIIGKNQSSPVINNSNYRTFNRINNDIAAIINSRSMVSRAIQNQQVQTANPSWQVSFGDDFMAIPVATNKSQRISMYRNIAAYPVCKWCLDEIADDFIHEDEEGKFIRLKLPDRLSPTQQDIIQNEFNKYINLFNLRDDGFNLIRRFLTEGELAWENVINPKYQELGIQGVRFLPAEYYETYLDPDSGLPSGIVFNVDQYTIDRQELFMNSITGSASIFNAIAPMSYSYQFASETSVPLPYVQMTYINSGDYSDDYITSYPLVENVKQQYHRLALLEDAAVILRVTHAPERMLFNISTGKMTQNYADEYVRRFAMELKSKKVAQEGPGGPDIAGVYNAPTMLKAYVFGKSDGNEGTQVQSVGSSANYEQMEDVEYFLRAVLKQFKVPWTRWKTPENTMEKNESITYEEYDFSRMIMRFQRRFASGFKKAFITHLKLRGIWDKDGYELQDSDIDIGFTPPVLYDLYEKQKMVDAKMTIYKAFADADEISKIVCLKKYLGYSDRDIEENYKSLIKEKQMVAVGDFFAEQITEENPPVDFKSPIRLKKDVDAEEKINANLPAQDAGGGDAGGGDAGGGDAGGGDAGGGDAGGGADAGPAPAEPPSFGLG